MQWCIIKLVPSVGNCGLIVRGTLKNNLFIYLFTILKIVAQVQL